MRTVLLALVLGACGHSAGSGLKPMVDSPVIKFKAPDADAIEDLTGIEEPPALTGPGGSGAPAEGGK